MRVGLRLEGPIERIAGAAKQVPTPFFESFVAAAMARTIMAGASLGVFEALAEHPDGPAELARRLDLDEAGVDTLLVALHALGYVERSNGRYEVTDDVRRWVLPEGERTVGTYVGEFNYDMWDHFAHLERVLRGENPHEIHAKEPDDPYWERYMRALFELSRLGADDVARLIGARNPQRLLDLAGGHGGYAMAMCRRHPELQATIADLDGAARIGRAIVGEHGMSEQISYLVGDMFETDLGTGYDVATAHSIVHHFDPQRNVALLRRAHGALRPGGTMAVMELERPEPGEAGTQVGTLTGLLFYATSGARTYTAAEIESWLEEAGFSNVRSRHHPRLAGSVLVLGRA